MTTKFTPVAAGGSGSGSLIAMQMFDGSHDLLTAFRNKSGDLELLAIATDNGLIKQVSGAQAGNVSEVALTLMGRHAVTAVCSGSGNLLLISWDVPGGLHTVTRLKDSGTAAGAATQIAIAPVSLTLLVTALRDGSGNLLLISWALNPDGSFTRLGDSHPPGKPNQAGAVSLVTMVSLASPTVPLASPADVFTAVRNGSGDLELIAWRISADGHTITRQGPGTTAGAVSEIALTAGPQTEFSSLPVVTAVRDGSGNLLVIPWQVIPPGTFERKGSVQAGSAQHISISRVGGPSTLVASMRNGSGKFELIAFNVDSHHGGGLARTGDFSGSQSDADVDETRIISMGGMALTATSQRNAFQLRSWTVTSS